MNKELALWKFVVERLARNENVMLLVVAESSGSSPGRRGYKMAVGADGELVGSVGGGVMEVSLVEKARAALSDAPKFGPGELSEQVHRKSVPNASGMICSGKQTVIFKMLGHRDLGTVQRAIDSLTDRRREILRISNDVFSVAPQADNADFIFSKLYESHFLYEERLGNKDYLYIIGGGHCALALSELMSRLDFHISIFDDRPELNTIEKNNFAHEIKLIGSYEKIGQEIPTGANIYVVVMTLGYESDDVVIRQILDKDFKYLGVLGSKAKMATLLNSLRSDGFPANRITRIHTPIGVPINSRTPEEIAVSIAAEIIAVKNASG